MTKTKSMSCIMIIIAITLMACGESSDGGTTSPEVEDPTIQFSLATVIEGNDLVFEGRIPGPAEKEISIDYEVTGLTAEPGKDFQTMSGQVMIGIGERSAEIRVATEDDDVNELDEKVKLTLKSLNNVKADILSYEGRIRDNDEPASNENGYITADSYYGYKLTWGDEFDTEIDMDSYTFEMGDGCPNVCGWGNNELQMYTGSSENVFNRDGALVIKAIEESPGQYTSTRMITKGKREFTFGRIDIRAKLPEGQGVWPALWMLGANIDEVSWPNCGEIDIMEMVGHEPEKTHGTAHWGPQGGGSTFITGSKSHSKKLSQDFHVYTLHWERNSLKWYFDEEHFHTITNTNVTNTVYPFNSPFFFIFNIAVGGNWPGDPDETTVFPQEMEIDYIRVFQEE